MSDRVHRSRGSRGSRGSARIKRSVFISAPASVDTSVIRRLVKRHGATPVTSEDFARPGRTVAEIVSEGIAGSERVVALVDDAGRNGNVLFEVGMAVGMGKPALLITAKAGAIPDDLAGIPYLRARPDDEEALRFGLEHFLSAPKNGSPAAAEAGAETRPLGEEVQPLLKQLGTHPTEEALVSLIDRALMLSGVQVRSNPRPVGEGQKGVPDLAVWSQDLLPWIGNPLVIEVRSDLRTAKDAERTAKALQDAAGMSASRWGLLLYKKAAPEAKAALERVPILAESVETFLRDLRAASFGEVVTRLRNRAVHSAPANG